MDLIVQESRLGGCKNEPFKVLDSTGVPCHISNHGGEQAAYSLFHRCSVIGYDHAFSSFLLQVFDVFDGRVGRRPFGDFFQVYVLQSAT